MAQTGTGKPNVIMVHDGSQPYVTLAKHQAVKFGNRIVHRGSLEALPGMEKFEARYRQMSSYSRAFDMGCFKRFYILRQVMDELDLASLFHIDSDVLLFEDLHALERDALIPQGVVCGLHMTAHQLPMRMSFGAHTSYWTRPAIQSFCDFLDEIYVDLPPSVHEKWRWHRENNVPGGICDMTMLYLWAKARGDIANFATPIGGAVFDFNINASENLIRDEYRTRLGKKAIVFRGGLPWCDRVDGSGPVRFRSLHFQGAAKSQMARVSEGRSLPLTWLMRDRVLPALRSLRARLKASA